MASSLSIRHPQPVPQAMGGHQPPDRPLTLLPAQDPGQHPGPEPWRPGSHSADRDVGQGSDDHRREEVGKVATSIGP